MVQESWLVSEFCDKGNLDRAVSGGRFHNKATGAPDLVSGGYHFCSKIANFNFLASIRMAT